MKLGASFCLVLTLALPSSCLNGNHHTNVTSPPEGDDYNPHPCLPTSNNNGYNLFRRKHILGTQFDTNRKRAWSSYLDSRKLCGRVRVQSFLQKADETAVENICQGGGRIMRRNLCISRRVFLVYAIRSRKRRGKRCIILRIQKRQQRVVVACDKIANQCLPVHYEGYRGQQPNPNAQICR